MWFDHLTVNDFVSRSSTAKMRLSKPASTRHRSYMLTVCFSLRDKQIIFVFVLFRRSFFQVL